MAWPQQATLAVDVAVRAPHEHRVPWEAIGQGRRPLHAGLIPVAGATAADPTVEDAGRQTQREGADDESRRQTGLVPAAQLGDQLVDRVVRDRLGTAALLLLTPLEVPNKA